MKRFNLEDYHEDSIVVTGTGQPVNIFTTEALGDYPVVGQYMDSEGIASFTPGGIEDIGFNRFHENNLFFKAKVVTKYVRVKMSIAWAVYFDSERACRAYYLPRGESNITIATLTWEE